MSTVYDRLLNTAELIIGGDRSPVKRLKPREQVRGNHPKNNRQTEGQFISLAVFSRALLQRNSLAPPKNGSTIHMYNVNLGKSRRLLRHVSECSRRPSQNLSLVCIWACWNYRYRAVTPVTLLCINGFTV